MTGKMIEDLAKISADADRRGEFDSGSTVWLAEQLANFIDNHKRRGFNRERFLNDALPVSRPFPPTPGLEGFDL